MTPEEQRAYFAGCLDCDGCISCSKINSATPRIRITVANNDYLLLKTLQEAYGGGISYSGQTCAAWFIDAKEPQLRFLLDVLPYALIKRPIVKLAINFLCQDVGMGGSGHEKERARRQVIGVLITRFNHRFRKGDACLRRNQAFQANGTDDPLLTKLQNEGGPKK